MLERWILGYSHCSGALDDLLVHMSSKHVCQDKRYIIFGILIHLCLVVISSWSLWIQLNELWNLYSLLWIVLSIVVYCETVMYYLRVAYVSMTDSHIGSMQKSEGLETDTSYNAAQVERIAVLARWNRK